MPELVLEAANIEKSFGMKHLFRIPRLEIYDGERIGLVGENGSGKSTLLSILAGTVQPDSGFVRRLAAVGWIRQIGDADTEVSDSRLRSEFAVQQCRDGLSGGEKTRRRIAAALERRGSLLLADEPTTDLDTQGVELLQGRLRKYDGAALMVSHDRALLDALCDRIWFLNGETLEEYSGNYSSFLEERQRRREFQRFEYDQYRREQQRLRESMQEKVERAGQVHLPARMGNSEARLHKRCVSASQASQHACRKALESRLRMLERKERPQDDPEIKAELGAASPVVSRTVLEVRRLSLRFDGRTLLAGADMRLPTGSKTALLGPNGSGKTSLLRRIAAGDPAARFSPGVKPGWFDQDHASTLDPVGSILENVMRDCVYDESVARTVLARLDLRGNEVFRDVGTLSGGERAKTALAKLMLSDVNFLMLDEPTNHLDVFTLTALEEMLSAYKGTLLLVSHDRAFVGRLADRLVFIEEKKLRTFEGNLDAYEAALSAKPDAEALRTEISALEMRMAVLSARMDAPSGNDDADALRREFFELASRKRNLLSKNQ